MKGTGSTLVASAEKAVQKSIEDVDSTIEHTQGVLSLGEISSGKNGFLEFYNKTLVIGALTK